MPGFLGYAGKINDFTFPKEVRNDLVIDHDNIDLGKFLNSYFNENIKLLDDDRELKKDCEYLYKSGVTIMP